MHARNATRKLIERVREEAGACAHLPTTENNKNALSRIVERPEAQIAWQKLAEKAGDEFDSSLVLQIVGHAAISGQLKVRSPQALIDRTVC